MPLTMLELVRELGAVGGKMDPAEIAEAVQVVRRMLEMAAPWLPPKYRLAAYALSTVIEMMHQQIGPTLHGDVLNKG